MNFRNLDPGDPALQDYDPGHPWYYKQGGRALQPEEIRGHVGSLPYDTKYTPDRGKYRQVLMAMRRKAQKELERDIERYQEVLTTPEEPMFGESQEEAQEEAISLVHSHIHHGRSLINGIDNELLLLDGRTLYSQCTVDLLLREWLGKKHKAGERGGGLGRSPMMGFCGG